MPATLDPISPVSAAGPGAVDRAGFAETSMTTSGAAGATTSSGAGEAFRSLLETFQGATGQFEAQAGANAADPVRAARDAFVAPGAESGSVAIAPAPLTGAGNGAEAPSQGQQLLQKSFDHAIFVTLVSQVVSGVSQATTTLVRQQ